MVNRGCTVASLSTTSLILSLIFSLSLFLEVLGKILASIELLVSGQIAIQKLIRLFSIILDRTILHLDRSEDRKDSSWWKSHER